MRPRPNGSSSPRPAPGRISRKRSKAARAWSSSPPRRSDLTTAVRPPPDGARCIHWRSVGGTMLLWAGIRRAVTRFNIVCGYASAVVIVLAALLLCYEVSARYFFSKPTTWVLEASVFMLVAATFMGAAYTQLLRGHVAITVLDGLLPARVNAWRGLVNDIIAFAFCCVVAAMAWVHWRTAWSEGWTAPTLWAPKMWIPHLFIAIGMTALCVQQLIQIVDERIGALRSGA